MTERTAKVRKMIEEINTRIANLPSDLLFEKPSAEKWGIAEHLHHLIVSNETYFKVFDDLLAGKFKPTFWQRKSPFTKSIGENMKKTLGPGVAKKFKSPKLFLPNSVKKIKPSIVRDFLAQQEKLIRYLENLEKKQFKNTVISSPVSSLITLSLSDALDVIVLHEQRHMESISRLVRE